MNKNVSKISESIEEKMYNYRLKARVVEIAMKAKPLSFLTL